MLQHLWRLKIRSLLSGIRNRKQLKLPVGKEERKRRKIESPLSFVGLKHNYCMLPFAFYSKIHSDNKFFGIAYLLFLIKAKAKVFLSVVLFILNSIFEHVNKLLKFKSSMIIIKRTTCDAGQ